MILAFTGSRRGMTAPQQDAFLDYLRKSHPRVLHHGDAIGADADAHEIAAAQGVEIHVHPGPDVTQRSFCHGGVVHPPKAFMDRNRDIVNASDRLVAAPATPEHETKGSGTWRTVRYARSLGRSITIIWPDGSVDGETGIGGAVRET